MGFLAPKINTPTPPPAPDPIPQVERIEQETLADISEKQRRRKGLESTLLSQKKPDQNPSSGIQPQGRSTLG